jgi:hypothetical protein
VAKSTGGVSPPVLEDPKSQRLDYKWCEVGILDYDEENKLYLVHKTDEKGLVRDETGMPILNGGVTDKGMSSASPRWTPSSVLAHSRKSRHRHHQLRSDFCLQFNLWLSVP